MCEFLPLFKTIHTICTICYSRLYFAIYSGFPDLVLVVRNHYPVDSVFCFVKTYPLDSDLSGG